VARKRVQFTQREPGRGQHDTGDEAQGTPANWDDASPICSTVLDQRGASRRQAGGEESESSESETEASSKMANQRVLVLGGNFAGVMAALSVKRELGDDVDVTVASKSDRFQFNPSLIWIPFGKRTVSSVTFPVAHTFESHEVNFVHGEATRIDTGSHRTKRRAGPTTTTTW
jgi:hypothetical protein